MFIGWGLFPPHPGTTLDPPELWSVTSAINDLSCPCALLTVDQVKKNFKPEAKRVRVEYSTKKNFEAAAKALGIMADLKSGVPRAGYRGVVSFYYNGRRVFLSPPGDWTKFDASWN